MRRFDFFYSWRDFGFGFELLTPNRATKNGHVSALNIMFGPARIVLWIGTQKSEPRLAWRVDGDGYVMLYHIRDVGNGTRVASFLTSADRDLCGEALQVEYLNRTFEREED